MSEDKKTSTEANWLAGNIRMVRRILKEGEVYGQELNSQSIKIAQVAERSHHNRLVELQKQGIKPDVTEDDSQYTKLLHQVNTMI